GYNRWFNKDEEDYKRAFELFHKASGILQEESISGLIDIPDFEISVRIMFRQAIDRRRRKLHKKIFLFKKTLERDSRYLDRFPYKGVLSPKDFKLNEDFESLIEHAKKTVDSKTPRSFQDFQSIIENLSEKSEKIASNQNRLEIIKNILFALECLLKILRFFFITGTTTTVIVTLFLILFRGVESSLSSITATDFIIFLKYGFFAGLFSGVLGTAIWIKKRFTKLYEKIDI
ncbi:unnamed protein product, partial [marine sediment metagenome]